MADFSFIHLRVHSTYSLLEGAIPLKELVKWCVKQKMPAVAVADHGNLFGSLEFSQAAAEAGVQPIIGCVLPVKPMDEEQAGRGGPAPPPYRIPVYVQNEKGWRNLLKLASQAYLQPAEAPGPLLALEDVRRHGEGLLALTGGICGPVGRLLLAGRAGAAESMLAELEDIFPGRLYVELMRHGLEAERRIEPKLMEWAYARGLPLVATNDAYFIDAGMYEAHDALLCVADGRYTSETDRRRLTPEHRLKTPQEMAVLFADLPEALRNTVAIARRCAFMVRPLAPILPRFTEGDAGENELLRSEARKGLEERLRRHVFTEGMSEAEKEERAKPYCERLEFEIETIIKMKFPGYFLIVSDFIRWSKARGIPVGPGRGSGAGSVAAWALSITDLDPLRYGLLFERFLNPERVSMPDFDVDFCQDRRDEVILYVRDKYGADRVAQIITFGKLQARAVLRDVGRVLQMPYGQVDRICKLVPNNPAHPVTLEEAIAMEPMLKAAIGEDESVARLVDIGKKLEGLNRHASTHAAGVVIADRPLSELAPLYRDPKSDMPVVQYSMKYAEAAGLVKFDFLGLKTLTVLVRAVEMIRGQGTEVDLLALPEGDRKTYEMLSRGETVGVFQLESQGMRDTLRKLKPDCLEDIIALVSLYRPGPMDNIPTYIARKHGHEKPEYLHPLLKPVLKETFGVIIYQEQVMQIAQLLAGYSLGEADLLRRAMGKKIRAEMEAQRDVFVRRAVERGIGRAQAAGIFDLIAKFAEYGFNKSHAAAYAVIAYQTAYLKANHPVEFLAASMTCDMHNTDKLSVFREEASRFGIRLLPPDVNRSGVDFTVEDGAVRYALAAVRNVGAHAMREVAAEREKNGPFGDIFEFSSRISRHALNRRALEHLVKAGAFDGLHTNRRRLFDALDMVIAYGARLQEEKESSQVSLFGDAVESGLHRPALPAVPEWPALERLHYEFAAIGFYLSAHPLAAYRRVLQAKNVVPSSRFPLRLGGQYAQIRVAGIVTGKKVRTSERGRFAFVQLSDMDGMFEVSVFKEALLQQAHELLEPGKLLFLEVDGKLEESGPRLIAQSIQDLEKLPVPERECVPLHLRINNTQGPAALKGLLAPSAQGAEVMLYAALGDGREAEIRLPGKYVLPPASVGGMAALPGVELMHELTE